jgi:hypothetical protein
MGQFLMEVADFYKSHYNTPLDFNKAPVKYNALARNELAKLISNTLFEHRMQIRGLTHTETTCNPAQFLSPQVYQDTHALLHTVRSRSNTGRQTRASAQNRSKETKSFDFFAKAVKSLAVRSELCSLIYTPIWFSEISCGINMILSYLCLFSRSCSARQNGLFNQSL